MKRIIKSAVPGPAKAFLRKCHRRIVFKRSMVQFLAAPTDPKNREAGLLSKLQYGWGNNWSAKNEYLQLCLAYLSENPGATLECGSGLSTVLLGAVAQEQKQPYLALEHIPGWVSKVNADLVRFGITFARVEHCPLTNYGDFEWYGPWPRLEGALDLVICDGPPGETTKGGRYGALPQLRDQLRPGSVILLDDAERDDERAIVSRWAAEYGVDVDFQGTDGCIAKLTIV